MSFPLAMRYTAAAAILASVFQVVVAQGDAAALVAGTVNNPTKSWSQWQPKPTYALNELPEQYMGANRIPGGGEAQSGWNQCAANSWNQKSQCQTAHLNDLQDWCIWGPPDGGEIGSTERVAVAYCTTNKHGTRLIPDGTITGAHFLQTPNYVQISGTGDFTSLGIPEGDSGGEMDSAGADDLSNPIGGVMFTTAQPGTNNVPTQLRHWTNFMSWNQYCLRACWGPNASQHCEHKLDIMGCMFNMPSTSGYTAGVFESCEGENAPFQGVYDGSTFNQGDAVTPAAHPPAASSDCVTTSSIRHGLLAVPSSSSAAPTTMSTSMSSAPITISASSPTTSSSTAGGSNTAANQSSQGNGASGVTIGSGICITIVALVAVFMV